MTEQILELSRAVESAKKVLIKLRKPITSTTVLLCLREEFTPIVDKYGHLIDPATWFKHRNRSLAENREDYRKAKNEKLWIRKIAIYGKPSCIVCGNNDGPAFRRQKAIHITWRDTCSKACRCASSESKRKRAATNTKKYGVPHPSLHPDVQRKSQRTMKRRHGVRYAMQSKTIQKKANITMKKRFGVEWAMQNPDILFKQQINSYKIKTVCIKGNIYHLQGYEPQAVEWLLDKGFKVHDSRSRRYRTFTYVSGGKKRTYLPDLVVSKKNRYFVEVKSPFTAGITLRRGNVKFQNLARKARAVVASGSRFMLVVVTPKGEIIAYRKMPTWSELKSTS